MHTFHSEPRRIDAIALGTKSCAVRVNKVRYLQFQVLHLDHLAEGALTERVDDFVCNATKATQLIKCTLHKVMMESALVFHSL